MILCSAILRRLEARKGGGIASKTALDPISSAEKRGRRKGGIT